MPQGLLLVHSDLPMSLGPYDWTDQKVALVPTSSPYVYQVSGADLFYWIVYCALYWIQSFFNT